MAADPNKIHEAGIDSGGATGPWPGARLATIRGYRIDLPAVEAALRSEPTVADVAALCLGDAAGDARLVAYVMPASLDAESLRRSLLAKLPDYMVPSAIIAVAQLPRRPDGSPDLARLPDPAEAPVSAAADETPVGPVEARIADIWCEVLGLSSVRRSDDFFALGGTPATVARMVAVMRQEGLETDIRTVVANPRLADLAAIVAGEDVQPAPKPRDLASGAAAVPDPAAAFPPQDLPPAPPNAIPADCDTITPRMLSMLVLDQDEIDAVVGAVPDGARNVQDIYPVTPLQEGMLYQHRLQQEGDTFLMRELLAFDSRERLDAFLDALNAAVGRHDCLRTALHWESLQHPVQVVWRRAVLPVQTHSIDAGADVLATIRERTDPARLRLDLGKAPLLAAHVAEDAANRRWLLALVQHQIVGDRRSLDAILREIAAAMAGIAVPAPGIAYRDYVARSRAIPAQEHEAFLREQLGDVVEPTEPFDLHAGQGGAAAVGETSRLFDPDAVRRLHAAAAGHEATPSAVFHLAWATVVARCSGRSDPVFCTVSTGWSPHQGRLPAGLCMNTLPMRLSLGGLGAGDALRLTQRTLDAMRRHEHAPLPLAQRCSGIPGHGPLSSALLNFRPAADTKAEDAARANAPEVAAGAIRIASDERTGFPLSLVIDEMATGYRLTVQCAGAVDPARVMGYMVAALDSLLAALEQGGAAEVLGLDLLTPVEREAFEAFRRGCPDRTVPAASDEAPIAALRTASLLDLLGRSAALTPDEVALVFEGERLTFRDLEVQANRLAHELIGRGAGRGRLVGLCLERTPRMLVALLAVLKSGAGYVPLDPAYPGERLRDMAGDARIALLVAQASTRGAVDWPSEATLLLDEDAARIAEQPDSAPAIDVRDDDVAYVIYTSGSTGKPKGVVLSHGAVANFLLGVMQEPGLQAGDRVLAVTTLSFDIAVLELMLPLVVGARIVLASREVAHDPAALRRLVEDAGVTVMQATPPTWRLLLDAGWRGAPAVKALVGGEALRPDLARELLERTGELWNMYGPTEATVWATCWRVADPESGIAIGRALPHYFVQVLDLEGRPCPAGVAGEICISGPGLAQGYLYRPELTAERFVRFDNGTGQGRYYRTGDRGRFREDGLLEHLGRLDFQVKVRGHRIELGEIEVTLASHPAVASTVVVTSEPTAGDVRIVAFVVLRDGHELEPADLRSHLARTLPDYMLPQHYVAIDQVPLLPNGKVNRKQLSSMPLADQPSRDVEAPQGETETALAALWMEVLGVESIGRDDNFFDQGGHSLMALKLLHRLEQRFNRKLRLVTLFEAPTIRAQAALLQDQAPAPQTARCVVPIQANGSRPPLFFVSGWGGPILLLKALAKRLGSDQPLYLLDFMRLVEDGGRTGSIEEIAGGLLAELRLLHPNGPFHLAGYSLGAPIVYEMAQQLASEGIEVPTLALLDWFAPGHPRIPPFAVRTWLHLREAVRQGPVRMWPYLTYYTLRLKRLFVKSAPQLYPGLEGKEERAVTADLDNIAAPLLEAAERYQVRRYPGRVMFIRCDDLSESGIGTHDPDPLGGWGEWAREAVYIGSVPTKHSTLLFEEHADQVAALLTRCLALGREKPKAPA